jgi:glutamate/tyrosine decarboxylase-like PLP-dependent enzyme
MYPFTNLEDFRSAGHLLIEQIATSLQQLPERPVTTGEGPASISQRINKLNLPASGMDIHENLEQALSLLFQHSLHNGHPKFWGYITSSAMPVGMLADLLAASLNANVGAFQLAPIATEIEKQTIRWLAELIGFTNDCGGIFVSGGNMANFLGFLAARKRHCGPSFRQTGLQPDVLPWSALPWGMPHQVQQPDRQKMMIYCARGTHTWIEKAVELFGHGTDAIHWIELMDGHRMDPADLELQIKFDQLQGHQPFLVIGNAGTVSSGAIDPLEAIAGICKKYNLWFHVDGAYGAPAAALPEFEDTFAGLNLADSIALDPHKWLYAPLEAGCILVRNPEYLHNAFHFNPDYYQFQGNEQDRPMNFHEYGMQNSRGFKALKVWISLRHTGSEGIKKMIRKDIRLARQLFDRVIQEPELQAGSHNLSNTTFRYSPDGNFTDQYLNQLNRQLLDKLQQGGEVFLSNAIVSGNFFLRVCIVNFRTEWSDLEFLIEVVCREGRKLHQSLALLGENVVLQQ